MKTLFDSVDRMEGALTFHRHRHNVLSSNVANVDTPEYTPFDLERLAASDTPSVDGPLAMRATASGHLGAVDQTPGKLVVDASGEEGVDGNSVSLEHEMAKIDANRIRYSTTSELVSRRMAMLRYAAGDGS